MLALPTHRTTEWVIPSPGRPGGWTGVVGVGVAGLLLMFVQSADKKERLPLQTFSSVRSPDWGAAIRYVPAGQRNDSIGDIARNDRFNFGLADG